MKIKDLINSFYRAACETDDLEKALESEVCIDTGTCEALGIKGIGGFGDDGRFYLMTYKVEP